MLTVPDDHISEPNSFKISKTTETRLTLYKQPMLLSELKMLPSNEELALNIKYGTATVGLRCVSSNARRLWVTQLEQAIDLCAIAVAEQQHGKKLSTMNAKIIGRLLIDIMNVHNIQPKMFEGTSVLRISLGQAKECFDVDLSKKAELNLTTQFPFEHTSLCFTVALLQKNLYSPDVPLLVVALTCIRLTRSLSACGLSNSAIRFVFHFGNLDLNSGSEVTPCHSFSPGVPRTL
ncbi:hypothetical protein OESDEN_13924 [Oesophagostomum dentatum]|uniref:PH domain-containing protein n=1 Tax=Oesophagostomum dentatum TaxID=61180 RepID=A0A0B1SSZ5_OESDE|nr:hypothetical protein OESDEN_13924 [Oesophagostomum dentatum]